MNAAAMPQYSIPRTYRFVRDELTPEEHLDFHVKSGDYFATLSTILGLVASLLHDNVANNEPPHAYQIMALERLREDLLYLDRKYGIVPKAEREFDKLSFPDLR